MEGTFSLDPKESDNCQSFRPVRKDDLFQSFWKAYEACSLSPGEFLNILLASRYVLFQKDQEAAEEEAKKVRFVSLALKESHFVQ